MLSEHPLDEALGTRTSVRLLRCLTLSSKRELSGRELASLAGVSPTRAHLSLCRLEGLGLVTRRAVGRSDAWRWVGESALGALLQQTFVREKGLRSSLFQEVRRELEKLGVRRATVFGSFARGEEDPRSDLDLYVETRNEEMARSVREALLDLRLRLSLKYGVHLSALVYSPRQVRSPPNPALMENIRREGRPILEAA